MNWPSLREKEKVDETAAGHEQAAPSSHSDKTALDYSPRPTASPQQKRHVRSSALHSRTKKKVRYKRKVESRPLATPKHQTERDVRRRLADHQNDPRFQHELREMQEVEDLRKIDDDVEDEATLYEWFAMEHEHQEKSLRWYATFASAVTVAVGAMLFMANIFGAITISVIAGLVYFIAQREPNEVRYRVMVDGVAMNNFLYHYRDLQSFNIVYEPGETKTVILRSKRQFTPLLHMEIGEADPLIIRDILLEFLEEDLDMEEPLTDVWARRLGF